MSDIDLAITDSELADVEARVTGALRAVAGTVPDEPPVAFSAEGAHPVGLDRRVGHGGRGRARRFRSGRVAVIGATAAAACAAAVGGLVVAAPSTMPSTNRTASHPPRPSSVTHPPPPSVTRQYRVLGYTPAQAITVTAQCLRAAGDAGVQGAALRATFTDASGSTLVVTTPSGWYACDESADGTAFTSTAFESYAQVQGWASPVMRAQQAALAKAHGWPAPDLPTPPPGDLSAHWIMTPVELASEGGGYYGKTTMGEGWLDTAIGRVAPDVTKVTIQMPGGSMMTATVENGFFVARQLLTSDPGFGQAGTIPIVAYDASGKVVYNSLTRTSAPCYVTPTGQPLTPNASKGSGCQTGIAWPG